MSAPHIPLPDEIERGFGCVHGARCGGCAFLGVPLAVQLAHKQRSVSSALEPYAALRDLPVAPARAAQPLLGYRARAKLVISPQAEVGLYARGSHDVVDIPECRVLHPLLLGIVAQVRSALQGGAAPQGLYGLDLRLVEDGSEPAALLTFNGDSSRRAELSEFARRFAGAVGVRGVALRLQSEAAVQQLEGEIEAVWGEPVLRDRLHPDGLYHYAAAGGFVQAHRGQAAAIAERSLARLRTALGGLRGQRVLELYAGAGALGLSLCRAGAQVQLCERYAPALEHAERAAREQGLTGLAAVSGDAERVLEAAAASARAGGAGFDAVIVNPPRRGLTPKLRAALAALTARAVIYISCEPSTLARDLADLARRGLAADGVEPFDMMPLSDAVESLVLLRPAAPPPIAVLYEDAELLVVDKPPHLPTIPEAEHALSLLECLRAQHALPELSALHRLDAGTSGVCLFAKQRSLVHGLAERLGAGSKHYLALVRGNLRAKGIVRASLRDGGHTRPAITRYTRLERLGGHALARVRPQHGRTHQVRKHLAAIGHPLLGDARYGDAASNRYFEHKHALDRPFLHCARIELAGAAGAEALRFESALAPDLAQVLASLRAAGAFTGARF